MDFTVAADHRLKVKENKKKDKYLDLARKLKKNTMEHENNSYPNCRWCSGYSHQRFGKKTRRVRNKRLSGDHPNYSIVEIGQDT